MVGRIISHYRILEELGAGATGIVYRAEDTRLGRRVALKLLRPEVLGDAETIARFRREARITAALRHANICAVHEVGEHRGQRFIVLELLEGAPLDRLVAAGPAPPGDVLRLGLDVCAALEAAHAHGVVHRDIKPSNIFVARDGHAKVMDFGLAKRLGRGAAPNDLTRMLDSAGDLTRPGMTVGTMAYMAPEQARGQAVDARADLFSLGAVLYEMATGTRAFPGATMAAVFDALLNRDPRPAHEVHPGVPPALAAVLAHTLQKDPHERPQRAAALRAALRAAAAGPPGAGRPVAGSTGAPTAGPAGPRAPDTGRATRRWWWAAGAAALLVVALVSAGVRARRAPAATTPPRERGAVLLGTFANTTGDSVFDDTLRHAVAVHLGGSPAIDVMGDERVREGLRLMGRPPDAPLTGEVSREVCLRQDADAVVEGRIDAAEGAYVIRIDALACTDARTIASRQVTAARKEDVLHEIGRAAAAVRAALVVTLARRDPSPESPVESATTPSLDALKAYTEGVASRARGAELDAIPHFERAVTLDPNFASAFYALSSIYGSAGDAARGEEYARLAYAAREHVSERERLSIAFQYHDRVTGDLDRAIAGLQVWAQSYPRDHVPSNSLAVIYNRIGQFERAVEAASEARRRNPDHAFPYSNLAYAYRGLNRYAEAHDAAMQAVSRGIETIPTRRLLYQLTVMDGDATGAAAHLAAVRGRAREFDLVGARAQVAAFEGRRDEARSLYAATEAMARSGRLAELADGYALQAGWMEYALGDAASAELRVRPLLAARDPAVRLGAVTVLVLGGRTRDLDAVVDQVAAARPDDTLIQAVSLPVARAALALARSNPQAAIAHLEPTIPYEAGRMAAMLPVWLRGLALLAAGDGAAAAVQFRHVLERRGSDPFSICYATAPLHLARALDLAGDSAGAAAARDGLRRQWARADAGLLALQLPGRLGNAERALPPAAAPAGPR